MVQRVKVREKYESDPKKIYTMLTDQYKSVFRTKNIENIHDEIFNQFYENAITDVKVTESNIITAIHQLKGNSASGSDGIPAIFLIKTKITIAKLMMLLLRQSLDNSSMTEVHKRAYVLPIHK